MASYGCLILFFSDQANKIIFDIGANIGIYSSLVRNLNSDSVVYAFEPHPDSFVELSESAIAHNFHAHNFGFSDQVGKALLYDVQDGVNSELASLHLGVFTGIHHKQTKNYEVLLDTIDNFCSQNNIASIDLLKIDTEGHDYSVLLGATRLLAGGVKVIQFEFNEMNVASRVFLKDFIDLLAGYELFILLADGLMPIKYSPVKSEIFAFCNIVAIKKEYLSSFGKY